MPTQTLAPQSRIASARTAIAGGAAILIAAIWIIAVLSVQSLRRDELADAYTSTANLAKAFEEHVVRTLDAVDQALLRIKLEHERRRKPLRTEELAAEHRAQDEVIGAIAITDANGNIVAHSLPFKPANVSDRAHFQAAAARDTGKPEIGTPSRGQVTGLWSFPVVRRLNRPDGSFAGVAHVSLEIAYFEKFYKELNLGRDGLIALDGLDGVRRAGVRRESTDAGQRLGDGNVTMQRVARGELRGSHLSAGSIDGIRRVTTYRTLERYPLIVVVGISEREALAHAAEFSRDYYTGAAAFSAFILLMAFLLTRAIRQQEQAERLLLGQKEILHGIAAGRPLADSLEAICRLVDAEGDGMLCSILLLDTEGVHVRHGAAPSLPPEFVRRIDGLPIGPAAGSCGTAAFARKQVVVEDIATDPLWADYRDWALPHGLRACWSTPIFDAQQNVLGTFAMYFREPRRPVQGDLKLIEIAAQTAAVAISHKREEDALRESETRLRLAVHASNIGLWDWDIAGNHLYYSPEWKSQLGYREDEIPARFGEWRERLHPDDRESVLPKVRKYLADPRGNYEAEFRLRHKDGSYRWIYARAQVETDVTGTPQRMLGCHVDITDRKRAEEELQQSFFRLQELSRRLVEVEEVERRNINRELHDRVGQNLSALNLSLGIIRNGLSERPLQEVNARLDDARMLLEMTSKQVRDVMAELRPAALDDYGLFAALRHHAVTVTERLGIAVAVAGKDLLSRLPPVTETALFRIVQEALNNVAKHARAREVKIVLGETSRRVKLSIIDDGIGFDAARRAQGAPTYGIVTMHERAEAVGARLKIESAPGQGTRVEVEVTKTPV